MLEGIHWLPVLIAAGAGYVLGALWFLPGLFGTAWMRALGKTRQELGSPAQALMVTAVTTLVTAVCLGLIIKGIGIDTLIGGVVMGVVIGGGVVFATMLSDYLFQGQRSALLWIQGGYRFVYVIVMCAIIAGWPH